MAKQSIEMKMPIIRKTSKGEERRAKILQAAIDIFAEKGFDAASTRLIATTAGIEQGHLTYHLPNKELLWRAAADQRISAVPRQASSAFSIPRRCWKQLR